MVNIMKNYLVSLTFRYIESNHETYCILTEEQYNEYKEFFCETCKEFTKEQLGFGEDGELDAMPEISIDDIQTSLDCAVEITPEIEKAMNLLRYFLPSQTNALCSIKSKIIENRYLEE